MNSPVHLTDPSIAQDVIVRALALAASTRLIELCGEFSMTTTEAQAFRADCEWLQIGFKHGQFTVHFGDPAIKDAMIRIDELVADWKPEDQP